MLANVFDDFSTGSTNYNSLAGETGLGLGFAKRFTTVLDGQISCSSMPDMGSTFWVRLPLELIAKLQSKNNPRIVFPKQVLRKYC
jgi:signal transduction histidine kinase